MRLALAGTEGEVAKLEQGWRELADRTSASYFSSFEYVWTAWAHFHRPGDRLCVVVASKDNSLVGIAPFYVTHVRRLGIPCRVVRFIATWEGDRPQILADGDVEGIWKDVINFLSGHHRGWDILELREQPVEGADGKGWSFLPPSGLRWESHRDVVDYYVPLEGNWDDYLRTLTANTRSDWRRKARRLREVHGDFGFECLSDPLRLKEGLDRFVAVERSGWKASAGIGLARDMVHRGFYADLLHRLASRDALRIHFLTSEGADIAAIINFVHGDVSYMRHTAYSPRYASFSPGVLLLAEVTRQLFDRRLREYDLLGMSEEDAPQRYKAQWARGRRETVALRAYREFSRVAPWLGARALYRRLRRVAFQSSRFSRPNLVRQVSTCFLPSRPRPIAR